MKKSKVSRSAPFATGTSLFKGLVRALKRESAEDLWYRKIDWTRYLDPAIAAEIQAVEYRNKILYLRAQSSTFAHRLHFLRKDLQQKLLSDYPGREIRDIRSKLARI